MQVIKTGISSVDALYGIDFTGNIIPHAWYSAICTDSGKPDLTAIVILSEILFWHRPREECDESDPGGIKLSKRFKSDLLQLSYRQLTMKFGFSKDQSRRAMDHLEKLGLIKRHFRTVITATGDKLGNVMYVELFSDKLIELTYLGSIAVPYRKKPTRVLDETDKGIGNIQTGDMKNPMTNTKTTTEITNKDYLSVYQDERARVREQVCYEYLIIDRKNDRGIIDNMIDLITEINLSAKSCHTINGEQIPTALVKERLKAIDIDMMKSVIDNIQSSGAEVRNVKAYMLTVLYNASMTYETDLDLKVRRDMYGKGASAWGA